MNSLWAVTDAGSVRPFLGPPAQVKTPPLPFKPITGGGTLFPCATVWAVLWPGVSGITHTHVELYWSTLRCTRTFGLAHEPDGALT